MGCIILVIFDICTYNVYTFKYTKCYYYYIKRLLNNLLKKRSEIIMSKKDTRILIRINENQKQAWEKFLEESDFDKLSQLIRTAVEDYIDKKSKADTQIPSKLKRIKTQELEEITKLIHIFTEQRKEIMEKIDDINSQLHQSRDTSAKHQLKGRMLQLLNELPCTSDFIAAQYGFRPEEEYIVIDELNDLCDKKIVRLRGDMKYEVIKKND